MSQAGVEIGGPKPGPRAPAQGMKEHEFGPRVLAVAVPVAGEAAGAPDLDPVGGAVDGAPEERGVDERLRQEHFVTEAGRPVAHQTARAQREHPRAEVARAAGEDQEARVVSDKVQAAEPDAVVPADPPVARPALQRRCREHRQRQPSPPMMSDIAHRLAHPRRRAEIVVRLHQVPEAGLVLRRHDVDGHLRKNRHGSPVPTTASRHSYQGAERKSTIRCNSLSDPAKARSTNPPWVNIEGLLTARREDVGLAPESPVPVHALRDGPTVSVPSSGDGGGKSNRPSQPRSGRMKSRRWLRRGRHPTAERSRPTRSSHLRLRPSPIDFGRPDLA